MSSRRSETRAEKSSSEQPQSIRLKWHKKTDEEERQEWVRIHRSSKKSPGAVIDEVYRHRDPIWTIVQESREPAKPTSTVTLWGKAEGEETKAARATAKAKEAKAKTERARSEKGQAKQ